MSVTPELLESVCQALAGGKAQQPEVDRAMRLAFPGIPFSLCFDNDIPSRLKPLATGEGFALYGLNTSQHCAAMTGLIEFADGLVIGLLDEDED